MTSGQLGKVGTGRGGVIFRMSQCWVSMSRCWVGEGRSKVSEGGIQLGDWGLQEFRRIQGRNLWRQVRLILRQVWRQSRCGQKNYIRFSTWVASFLQGRKTELLKKTQCRLKEGHRQCQKSSKSLKLLQSKEVKVTTDDRCIFAFFLVIKHL